MFQIIRYPWLTIEAGTGSGLYRSTDGGLTWQKLTQGLPQGPLGRIGVAVAPSNPRRVYAMIYAEHGRLWDEQGRWRQLVVRQQQPCSCARPFYFTSFAVSPENENKLYIGALDFTESDDGGRTITGSIRACTVTTMPVGRSREWRAHPRRKRRRRVRDQRRRTQLAGIQRHAHRAVLRGECHADSRWHPYIICGGLQDNEGWCGPSSSLDTRT